MRNAFAPIRFFDIHAVSALLLTAETPGLARVPAPVGAEFTQSSPASVKRAKRGMRRRVDGLPGASKTGANSGG